MYRHISQCNIEPPLLLLQPAYHRDAHLPLAEAPDPPNTVVPFMPATSSRPGPVFGAGNGVFRAPYAGKYAQSTNPSLPDSVPISSASSATPHLQSDISIYYQNVGRMNGLVDDYRLAVLDHSYDTDRNLA